MTKDMTIEDKQFLNDTHAYVKTLLNEEHITGSSELDEATRLNANNSSDIESMIAVLRVHKKYQEVNPPSAPIGMLGLQRAVVGSEAGSISETILGLTQLKARMKN